TFCRDGPFRPEPLVGAGHLPRGEGFLIRVPDIVRGKISAPSLPGKVAFALQEAKDGRVPPNCSAPPRWGKFGSANAPPNCSAPPRWGKFGSANAPPNCSAPPRLQQFLIFLR